MQQPSTHPIVDWILTACAVAFLSLIGLVVIGLMFVVR